MGLTARIRPGMTTCKASLDDTILVCSFFFAPSFFPAQSSATPLFCLVESTSQNGAPVAIYERSSLSSAVFHQTTDLLLLPLPPPPRRRRSCDPPLFAFSLAWKQMISPIDASLCCSLVCFWFFLFCLFVFFFGCVCLFAASISSLFFSEFLTDSTWSRNSIGRHLFFPYLFSTFFVISLSSFLKSMTHATSFVFNKLFSLKPKGS